MRDLEVLGSSRRYGRHSLAQSGLRPSYRRRAAFPLPWTRDAGIAPLKHSLVLTAVTGDLQLADRLLDEPTISNLYLGDHRTYVMKPGLPHDGYLAEFLMREQSRNPGLTRLASEFSTSTGHLVKVVCGATILVMGPSFRG